VISENGIQNGATKISCILEWKNTTNITGLKSFLGLVGYYRHFLEGFSHIPLPLLKLTRKEVAFLWTDECS